MMNKSPWMIVFVIALAAMAVIVALNGTPGVDSANISNGTIQEEDLLAINVATDGFAATYDAASGGFEWVAGGGGGVHPVDVASDVTGILAPANGGTGISTLPTTNNVLIGNIAGLYSMKSFIDCNNQNWYRLQFDGIGSDPQCDTDTISSAGITDNSVASADILLDTIVAVDIALGGVASSEILDNSVASADILLDTIVAVDIAVGGVATSEILDGTILVADWSDDTAVDGYVASYNSGGDNIEWIVGGGGGVTEIGRIEDNTAAPLLSLPYGWSAQSISTYFVLSGTMFYTPFYVPEEITLDALVIELTAAGAGGSLGRGCIYDADADFQPTDLVLDIGTFSIASIAVVTTTFTPQVLPAGNYMLAMVTNSNSTFRSLRSRSESLANHAAVAGAFPFLQSISVTGQVADVAGGCDDPATAPTAYAYNSTGFFNLAYYRISTP